MTPVAAGDQTTGDGSRFAIQEFVQVQCVEHKYSQTDWGKEQGTHHSNPGHTEISL